MSVEQFITEHLDLWAGAVSTKSSSGRSSNGKVDTTGIKKLRELILEFAVRGKLVPQNDSDEPAQTLQKRIAAEKARLQADGQIKKTKESPAVSEDEVRFDIPSNWIWTRLGTIAQISPRNTAEEKTEASFVPMPLITTSYTGEHSQEKRQWSVVKKGYTHFADGDIALAKITPCFENSKAAVFRNLHSGIGAGTTELHVARPYGSTIDPFFILCCLKSPGFLIRGEARMTGTAGQKRLPKDFFAKDPIPLPPLVEQHRIVQKVDELMALCDRLEQQTRDQHAAHETLVDALLDTLTQSKDADELAENWARLANHFDTLFTTDYSVDRLVQTVFELAITGHLVPQNENDDSAATLLKNIGRMRTQLVFEGQIRKQKVLPKVSKREISDFCTPNGWALCRLNDIGIWGSGATPRRSDARYYGGHINWFKSGELTDDWISESEEKITDAALAETSVRLNAPGDVLLAMYGATIGKASILKTPATTNQAVCACAPFSGVSNRYLLLLLKAYRARFTAMGAGGAQPNISREKIIRTVIALPPSDEQHRIVQKVDELMAACKKLRLRLEKATDIRRQMANAVVEQAIH